MAASKKNDVSFELVFEGSHLRPEKVPIGYLTRAFEAVRRLTIGHEVADEDESADPQEGALSLIKVRRGSAAFQLNSSLPEIAIANLRIAGEVLNRPESLGENDYVLSPVEELSSISKSLHTEIVLREPGKSGNILARIGPASYRSVSKSLLLYGDTELIGIVVRVGGATDERCGLRIAQRQRLLICRIAGNETARKLGQKLYEEVTVRGKATWLKTNWHIVNFVIDGVHQPRLGPAEELFESLRNAGGSGWDSIEDPETFLTGSNRER